MIYNRNHPQVKTLVFEYNHFASYVGKPCLMEVFCAKPKKFLVPMKSALERILSIYTKHDDWVDKEKVMFVNEFEYLGDLLVAFGKQINPSKIKPRMRAQKMLQICSNQIEGIKVLLFTPIEPEPIDIPLPPEPEPIDIPPPSTSEPADSDEEKSCFRRCCPIL